MNLEFRGPEGCAARIRDIESRLSALAPPVPKAPAGLAFKDVLQGQIGGAQPFDPFAGAAQLSPQTTPDLRAHIEAAAKEAGLDPHLLDAMVASESGYDPTARSRAGAMGLTQLMPDTARSLGVSNPFDPEQNLRGGARYLAGLIQRFQSPELALAAYNAGPGRVERAGNQIPDIAETQRYVQKVMSLYKARSG